MFTIVFKPAAIRRLRKMKQYHAVTIVDAIERQLREEPERITQGKIKRLRGEQETTFRLRAGEYRVFYDVIEDRVEIVEILHKAETASFYRQEGQ